MIDFIWHQCQNKVGFKRYNYQKLKDELSEFATSFPFMRTQEVVYWARECHPNISVHAYDSTYKKLPFLPLLFLSPPAPGPMLIKTLMFVRVIVLLYANTE